MASVTPATFSSTSINESMVMENSIPGGDFNLLDELLLVSLSLYFDAPSLANVLRSCRFWRDLERTRRRALWRSRILGQYGPLRLPGLGNRTAVNLGDSWRDFAIRLKRGRNDYVGAAIDAFTSGFEPYPMHVHLHSVHPRAGNSWIRWPTLRNSVTKLGNVKLHRCAESDLFERIHFSETLLVEGNNILIPNHYIGFMCGPAIVGVYPGGAFWLLLEEATSASLRNLSARYGTDDPATLLGEDLLSSENQRPSCRCWPLCRAAVGDASNDSVGELAMEVDHQSVSEAPTYGNAPVIDDFDPVRHKLVLRSYMKFIGLVAMELVPFRFDQTERQPLPSSTIIELDLGKRLHSCEVSEVLKDCSVPGLTFNAEDPGFAGQLRLRIRGTNADEKFSVVIVNVSNKCENEYGLVGLVTDRLDEDKRKPRGTIRGDASSEAIFLADSRLYGWLHGDCLIGILKNSKNQPASFNLQLCHTTKNQVSAIG